MPGYKLLFVSEDGVLGGKNPKGRWKFMKIFLATYEDFRLSFYSNILCGSFIWKKWNCVSKFAHPAGFSIRI